MSSIQGAHAFNDEAFFNTTSDPAYYEADGEGEQLYLESVLPHQYNPELEPFNTYGLRPKFYPEQNQYGFHPVLNNPYQHLQNNTDFYFRPEDRIYI